MMLDAYRLSKLYSTTTKNCQLFLDSLTVELNISHPANDNYPLNKTMTASSDKEKTPQQIIEGIVNTVLTEVYEGKNIPPEIKRRAKELAGKFEYADATYLGPEARRAAGREYDEWIDEIFRATQKGAWREDLLKQFIEKLDLFMQQGKTDALFAMVIEEIRSERQFVRYQLRAKAGNIHENRWRNYKTNLQDGLERPFFRALLDADPKHADINVWFGRALADVYPYTGELNALLHDPKTRDERGDNLLDVFWLSAMVLRSEQADQPHRLLLVAYPNHGTAVIPKVGRSATQEWRVMQLLHIAYQQLDHEIGNLDKRIAAQRGDMIRDLGQSFLAHELHTHLANLHDLQTMIINNMQPLLLHYPKDSNIQTVGTHVLEAAQQTTRLFNVVHAYNNMMRARGVESFTLSEVLEESIATIRVRARDYAKARILLERKRAHGINLETDHGLLLIVLINILVNATQAIHEARSSSSTVPEGGDRISILVDSEPEEAELALLIANTGPPIAPELQERVFDRGFTTRRHGHGQGLYLCKQILQSLGGSIHYCDPKQRGLPAGAAFCLKLNRIRQLKPSS